MKRKRNDGNETLNMILEILIILLIFAIILFAVYATPAYENLDSTFPTLAQNPTTNAVESEQTEELDNRNSMDSKSTIQKDPNAYYDLNTVNYEQLLTVEQIGESRAEAILSKREELGSFTSIEQLLEVDGIGESIYDTIAPHFYIG